MTEQWIDSHVHLVDFVQHPAEVAELRAAFADSGVERAVVFGLPVKKKWALPEPVRPHYYLDDNAACQYHSLTDLTALDLAAALETDGLRLAPLVCGFDPTDLLAVEHLEFVWSKSDRWAGVGELMMRHDDLTNLTAGEVASPDHPAMDPVLDFCAERGVPVSIHHDSSSPLRPAEHEYLPKLENALRRHRSTSVVWCHAGISRRVEPVQQLAMLTDLLTEHPNLTVELSWVLLDHIVEDRRAHPDWVRVVERFPHRFVAGSDTVASGPTVRQRSAQVLDFGAALSAGAREQVLRTNAQALWFR